MSEFATIRNRQGPPRFSVVLPVYDRQEATKRAIDFVLAQTFHDFELIIVDDGSPDAFRLTEAYRRDGRVRLIRQEENRGPGAARNIGAAAAQGEWIAWIDSDDCWYEEKLQRQAEQIAGIPAETLVAIATGFRYSGGVHRESRRIPVPAAAPQLFFAGYWFCPGTTTVVSRKTFWQVGGYDENLRRFEDVDWFIRFGLAGGRLCVVNEVLAEVSWHPPPPLPIIARAAEALILKMEPIARPAELRRLKAFLRLAMAASAWEEGQGFICAVELARSFALQPRLRLQLFDFWNPASTTEHSSGFSRSNETERQQNLFRIDDRRSSSHAAAAADGGSEHSGFASKRQLSPSRECFQARGLL